MVGKDLGHEKTLHGPVSPGALWLWDGGMCIVTEKTDLGPSPGTTS